MAHTLMELIFYTAHSLPQFYFQCKPVPTVLFWALIPRISEHGSVFSLFFYLHKAHSVCDAKKPPKQYCNRVPSLTEALAVMFSLVLAVYG